MDTDTIKTSQEVTTQEAESTTQPQTFTQEDVNRIVAKRVAKYSDYEDLKEKAAKFDAAEEANKSDLQKRSRGLTVCKANLIC